MTALDKAAVRGRLSRQQALAAGIPSSTLDGWVADGRLLRRRPNALQLRGAPDERVDRMLELLLSLKAEAYLCCWTALVWWGLWRGAPSTTWLLVAGKWAPKRPGLRVVTCRQLLRGHVTVHNGLPVTTAARTLVDMARLLDLATLRPIVIDAVQQGLTTWDELRIIADERNGARGTGLIRRVCDQLQPGNIQSPLELATREWIATTDLPPPAPAGCVRTPRGLRQLDIPWPQRCVWLDCDGFGYHSSRAAHDYDADRLTDLGTVDGCCGHVTWTKLEQRQPQLLEEVHTLFARADRNLGSGLWTPLQLIPLS